ncbi:MAG TPA: hypothetical protein VKV95_04485 [Terriglobia bacterium]|nr:hypothetical protein [Terriglobia bacterium]
MKTLSRVQIERRKAQAVRFAREVREDDDLADAIDDETLEEYAEKRHIHLVNPKGGRKMAIPTRRELTERVQELEEENENLQERLSEISELAGQEEEEESQD